MKPAGLLFASVAFLLFCAPALALPTNHSSAHARPLDPLDQNEHWRVLEILQASGKLTPKTRFNRIALSPPDMAKVLIWKPGTVLP